MPLSVPIDLRLGATYCSRSPASVMRAIVYSRCGPPDVLHSEEVAAPIPADDQVLIRVHAAALNPLDWRLMRGGPAPIRWLLNRGSKKTIPGRDVAGRVVAVGRKVTRFQPGDEVFGLCVGACADYACASEAALARKPARVSFQQAAALPIAGLTALQGLRDRGKIRAGQRVLVNGAAGGVGTFVVQIAKAFGASVTGVCSSGKLDLVRSLGADRIIDYTREDFTDSERNYDLIFDNVGTRALLKVRRVLSPTGTCVIAGAPKKARAIVGLLVRAVSLSCLGRRKFRFFLARRSAADLAVLGELVGSGRVTPVIDRQYSLAEVPQAMAYLEQGHAGGKVIVVTDVAAAANSTPASP